MPVVELAGVTKAYESKVAVSNLSLSIEAGHDGHHDSGLGQHPPV